MKQGFLIEDDLDLSVMGFASGAASQRAGLHLGEVEFTKILSSFSSVPSPRKSEGLNGYAHFGNVSWRKIAITRNIKRRPLLR